MAFDLYQKTSAHSLGMRVWVDLVNSPQVLVMTPIIRELERRGHEVIVTTRDFAQTVELADSKHLNHVALGKHGGANKRRTIQVNLERVALLIGHMRSRRPDLALSHNSYSQALAARVLRAPFVTLMDYEHHRANHLAFRLARRVLVPEAFPDASLSRFGALHKAVKYPGLKEELYLADFKPDPSSLDGLNLPEDRPIVVARPPGTWGDYYKGKGALFTAFLRKAASSDAFVVFLPRIADQRRLVSDFPTNRLLVPDRAVDGPNLLWRADLAVSGGGTMNREAAMLGTPAYTLFEGAIGGVDRFLERQGRLTVIEDVAHLEAIRFETKRQTSIPALNAGANRLLEFVTSSILCASQRQQ